MYGLQGDVQFVGTITMTITQDGGTFEGTHVLSGTRESLTFGSRRYDVIPGSFSGIIEEDGKPGTHQGGRPLSFTLLSRNCSDWSVVFTGHFFLATQGIDVTTPNMEIPDSPTTCRRAINFSTSFALRQP